MPDSQVASDLAREQGTMPSDFAGHCIPTTVLVKLYARQMVLAGSRRITPQPWRNCMQSLTAPLLHPRGPSTWRPWQQWHLIRQSVMSVAAGA